MHGQVSTTALDRAAQPSASLSWGRRARCFTGTLIVSASWHLALIAGCLVTAALVLNFVASFGWCGVVVALMSYFVVAGLVFANLHRHGRQLCFGAANALTLMRAAIATLFLGVLAHARLTESLTCNSDLRWILTAFAAAGLLTDGADGWLARHRGTASEFGARFDMETDALFMLTLSLLVHALGEIGGWVLLSGLMRYLFVGAGSLWSPLAAPLFPSFRRKSVCVLQMAILIGALAPAMPTQWASALCAVALSLLIYSFGWDLLWLAVTSGATRADADLPAASLHHHATEAAQRRVRRMQSGNAPER